MYIRSLMLTSYFVEFCWVSFVCRERHRIGENGSAQSKRGTNYLAWDLWEPDSDDAMEDDEHFAALSKNDPKFAALEADFQARQENRRAKAREANTVLSTSLAWSESA